MSSLKWQLTILDERDIARKGQCVINPVGTAVRWRPVHFLLKGLQKTLHFLYYNYGKEKNEIYLPTNRRCVSKN